MYIFCDIINLWKIIFILRLRGDKMDSQTAENINEQSIQETLLSQKLSRWEWEQKQRHEEEVQKEEILNIQARISEQATNYTNIIIVAGYAGLFSLWTLFRDNLYLRDSAIIAINILLSLCSFITWEITKMYIRCKGILKLNNILNSSPGELQSALDNQRKLDNKLSLKWDLIWSKIILPLTIIPGVIAAAYLIICFFRIILLIY